jgi:hypothetical protein
MSCPNCGYCKHCGRGGHWYAPTPYYPSLPTYPTYPVWPMPSWTVTSGGPVRLVPFGGTDATTTVKIGGGGQ